MLQAKAIKKSYGNVSVLKGVDFQCKPSELVTIVGRSGAGKSTFLQILGSLEKPDSGSILFEDADIATLKGEELSTFRNQKIGFIFQFHHLLPEFTAVENVCLPGFLYRERNAVKKNAIELLNLLGLGHRLEHKPNELSGGEQQRVAIARALINDPAIIFADEPSGNLDSVTAYDLHQLIVKLKNELGKTFVIVTHNEELASLSDRKLVMEDGIIL